MNDPKNPPFEPIYTRLATLDDAAGMAEIYNYEVENSTATMDLVPRTLNDQRLWINERSGAFSALVAVTRSADQPEVETVLGFAALSPFKERAAYRPTVEDSIYVHRDWARRGIGRQLLNELLQMAITSGFHSVMARIEASGTASQALHTSVGFRLVGVEIEVARKFNRWLDIVVMQRLLTEK
jgi:phosphinothricin acetyltransferase